MNILVTLAASVVVLAGGSASAPPIVAGQVIRSGLCAHNAGVRYELPQSTAGYATYGDLEIVADATVIPLKKNVAFGFAWRATGLPDDAEVDFIIQHPRITRPDGKALEGFVETLKPPSHDGVVLSTDCYILSEDHELVAGKWVIEVKYKGRSLARREFDVVGSQ